MNPQPTRHPDEPANPRHPGGWARRGIRLTRTAALALALSTLLSSQVAFGQYPETTDSPQAPASQPDAAPLPSSTGLDGQIGEEPDGHATLPKEEPLLQILGQYYPEKLHQLHDLRAKDPHKFAQVERQMRPWLHELREAGAQNPELAHLMVRMHRNEMEIREWQQQYRSADPKQRKALSDQGHKLAEARVDLRIQRDRLRIQIFEKRLQTLKMGLSEREAHKARIVDRELEQISAAGPDHANRSVP